MIDIELVKSRARIKKISLSELAEKIGYSAAGFHKAMQNETMNMKAVMKIGEVLDLPLADYIMNDVSLKLATVLNEKKSSTVEIKREELWKLIEQERDYLKVTIEGLLDQCQEKDKQIEILFKSLAQKDQLIADYLGLLKNMNEMQMPVIKDIMLKRKPVKYKALDEDED